MNVLTRLSYWRYAWMAFILLGTILVWTLCPRRFLSAYQAIPSQTAAVIVFQGYESTLKNDAFRQERLFDLSPFRKCAQDAREIIQLVGSDTVLQRAFDQNSLLAAFSLQPADSLHAVFALDMGRVVNLEEVLSGQTARYKYFSSVFKGQTLYTVHVSKNNRLVLAVVRNLLLFSRYSYLVEDAMLETNSRGNWWTKRAHAAGGGVAEIPLQIIIRPEILAQRCENYLAPMWKKFPEWLAGKLEWIDIFSNGRQWKATAGTDYHLKKAFQGPALQDAIYTVLPDNTALLGRLSYHLPSDFSALFSNGNSKGDYRQYVEPWLGKESAYVLLEPFSPGMMEDHYLVLEVQDSVDARLKLDAYGAQRGLLKHYVYQTFEVRQFLSQSFVSPLLGAVGEYAFRNPVITLLNGYAVVAPTTSAMEIWIDKYIVNQTLASNTDFLQLHQALPGKGNAMLLFNTAFIPMLLENIMAQDSSIVPGDIRVAQQSGFLKLDLRGVPGENRIGADLAVLASAIGQPESSVLWKVALGGEAINQPFVVQTRNKSTEPAILIQDDQFQLYRLTPGGGVLWRKQMDQPLLGGVTGIDFFSNGTLCYAFNTANAIWILDDNGKEVDGFPLKLQSMATNGVTIVDFDNDHKYTLFLVCANGNLYGFDQFGRPVPGWNPQQGVGRVRHPLVYFKNGTKDYLTVLDISGRLSVFNRSGKSHFPPLQFDGDFFVNPLQVDTSARKPRIVCMNGAGRVFVCSPDGQLFSMQLSHKPHAETNLVFDDLLGDSRKEYALLEGQKFSVSDYSGASFKTRFDGIFPVRPDTLFAAGCCHSVGALNRDKKQIFLADALNGIHPDFPLAGTTPFVLNRLFQGREEKILVVGNGRSIYAYKIPNTF